MLITVVDVIFRDIYSDDMMCRFQRRLIQDAIPTRLISDGLGTSYIGYDVQIQGDFR
jgi:hypothetical protein